MYLHGSCVNLFLYTCICMRAYVYGKHERTLRPMVILCLRVALTIWLLYVIICLYSDEIQDCLDGIDQPRLALLGAYIGMMCL